MKHHDLNHVFFDSTHQQFRTQNSHHCPRYVLFREYKIEHRMYSPVIDTVYDLTLAAANDLYPLTQVEHGNMTIGVCPLESQKNRPTITRVVMSSVVSQWIRDGKPPVEDVLIAGLYSHVIGTLRGEDVVTNLAYIQPRQLYNKGITLPVMYRPFFVTCNENLTALVNMQKTLASVRWAIDGMPKIEGYYTDKKIPEQRPWNFHTAESTACERCAYKQLCDTADRLKCFSIEKLRDVNLTPGVSKVFSGNRIGRTTASRG